MGIDNERFPIRIPKFVLDEMEEGQWYDLTREWRGGEIYNIKIRKSKKEEMK